MARVDKYKSSSVSNLGKHYSRSKNTNGELVKYKNQDIKPELSHLNYNLAPDHKMSHNEFIKKRLSEIKYLKRNDVNVMCSWVVTLPKTIEKDSNEEKLFFEKTYEFLKNKYLEKNVISAFVHKDENQPHIHFAFIPVTIDKKKGHEKLSAKELITRNDLKGFHTDLSKYLEQYFNRDIGIINESTRDGNKSIIDLKRGTAIEKVKELNDLIQKKEERLNFITSKIITLKNEIENNVVKKDENLKELNAIYRKKKELEIDIIQFKNKLLAYNSKK